MENAVQNCLSLLEKIEKDPVHYLGRASLERLGHFIGGYFYGQDEDAQQAIGVIQRKFRHMVYATYNMDMSAGNLYSVISFFGEDEKKSLQNFFDLWHTFLRQEPLCTHSHTGKCPTVNTIRDYFDMLSEIEQRPTAYIIRASLEKLECFLMGYCMGQTADVQQKINALQQHFTQYVRDEHNISVDQSVYHMVNFFNGGGKRSFYRFFDIWRTFLQAEKATTEYLLLADNGGDLQCFKSMMAQLAQSPSLYMGKPNLRKLKTLQNRMAGICSPSAQDDIAAYRAGFDNYVRQSLHSAAERDSYETIAFFTPDAADNIACFFKLWQQYEKQA